MNTKHRLGKIVIGALLLMSFLWVGSGWLNTFLEKERQVGMSGRMTMDQAGEHGEEAVEGGRNAVRDPAGKAKSLLDIRAGETGVFRVSLSSSGDKRALSGLDEIKGVPPGLPSLAGVVSKAGLVETFERTLRDGGKVIASVGDQDVTEYFFKDLYVRVEVVGKQSEFEDLRMEVRSKNSRIATDLTVRRGSAALFRLPEPDGDSVVVMRGKNEEGPTEEKQPTGE